MLPNGISDMPAQLKDTKIGAGIVAYVGASYYPNVSHRQNLECTYLD